MHRVLGAVVGAIVAALIKQKRRAAIDWLKIRAAIWYLRGVAQARLIAVRIGLVIAGLLLATAGFIAFHVGIFLWLPVSLALKGLLLAALGLIYVVLGWLVVRHLLSERAWLRSSGAQGFVDQMTRRED